MESVRQWRWCGVEVDVGGGLALLALALALVRAGGAAARATRTSTRTPSAHMRRASLIGIEREVRVVVRASGRIRAALIADAERRQLRLPAAEKWQLSEAASCTNHNPKSMYSYVEHVRSISRLTSEDILLYIRTRTSYAVLIGERWHKNLGGVAQ